jgi:O-antigen/teichoic acid export membrane protein
MFRILARNIASNWIGFAVQVLVAFFLTPFVLQGLGDARYGIWALVMGLTGYYGLLDMGFRAGITQYLTRRLATRDFEQMNRVASTAVVALGACSGLIAILSALLCWLAPRIFTIPPDSVAETRGCILILGISTAISFAFFTYSAVFAATQRYDLANAIAIAVRLVSAGGMVAALKGGYGLVGISLMNAAAELIGYLLRTVVAYRILPELKIDLHSAALAIIKQIASYSLWNVLIEGSRHLISYSDALVIGIFLPVAAITPYALAVSLTCYIDNLLGSATIVFFPAATNLHAHDKIDELRSLYLGGSRMMMHLAFAAGLVPALWAGDFFRLWVGAEFAESGDYSSTALIFQVLIAGLVVSAAPKIGSQVLAASLRMRLLAGLFLTEGIINLIASIILIRYYGVMGVAVGTLIPAIIVKGMAQPMIVCRYLEISPLHYLKHVCLGPLASGLLSFSLLAIIRYSMPSADTWGALVLQCSVASMLVLAILSFVGLNREERQLLLMRPLNAAWRRIKPLRYPADHPVFDKTNGK